MAGPSRALRNGLWNAGSRFVLGAAQIGGSILIVRSLSAASPDAYGRFAYFAAIAGFLMSLGVLALPQALTKIASELRGEGRSDQADALARRVARLLLGANLLLSAGFAVWGLLSPPPARGWLLAVAVAPALHALGRVMSSALWGAESYRPVSLATTAASVLQVIGIVLSWAFSWGVLGFLVSVIVVPNATLPLVLGVARLRGRPASGERAGGAPGAPPAGPAPERSPLLRTAVARYRRFAVPATLVMLFETVVWQRSEVLFLERLSTFEELGYYGLAFSVAFILVGFGLALINGYFPAISRSWGAQDIEAIRAQVREATLVSAAFALPFAFGAWAVLDELIPALYGAPMAPAALPAKILFLGLFASLLAGVHGMTVSAVNRIWLTLPIAVGMAAFNLALDFLLIPRFDAAGAAVANAAAQIVNGVAYGVLAFRLVPLAFPWRGVAFIAASAFVAAYAVPVGILRLAPGPWGLVAALGASVAVYGLLLLRTGVLGLLLPAARGRAPGIATR